MIQKTINLIDNELLYLLMYKLQGNSNFFLNIAKNLSLPENRAIKEPVVEVFTDPVKRALENCKDHPSTKPLKNKMTGIDNPEFSFWFLPLNERWS